MPATAKCGASSRPSTGYDFDTLAGDLHVLLSRLDLRGLVLAGFAMGTGEVTRYLATHGPGRVTAAVLVAPLLPFLLKTDDNPDGIDRRVFDGLTARIAADRPTRSTGHCSTSSAIRATLADSTAARKTGIKELDFSERPVVFLLANGRTPARVALLVAVPYPKCSKAADTVPPDWKA